MMILMVVIGALIFTNVVVDVCTYLYWIASPETAKAYCKMFGSFRPSGEVGRELARGHVIVRKLSSDWHTAARCRYTENGMLISDLAFHGGLAFGAIVRLLVFRQRWMFLPWGICRNPRPVKFSWRRIYTWDALLPSGAVELDIDGHPFSIQIPGKRWTSLQPHLPEPFTTEPD